MMNTNTIYKIVAAASLALACVACKENYITYHDGEYVMFADTAKVYVVREDIVSFDVPIVSTVACDYDRSFAVEIIDSSSDAVEGRDFVLESPNFVIPAGERVGYVTVKGNHETLPSRSELSFDLKLVMPDWLVMPLYGDKTTVHMKKTCKFNRENYTGWAMITSLFLYQYSITGDYQRLVRTSADPDDDHGVIIHDMFADGFDIKIRFDDESDPENPAVITLPRQVANEEGPVFGMVHGDNHILIDTSNQGPSYFFSCSKVAVLVNRFYVENIGDEVGTVGHFMTEIDWVSDEEAERLKREDGM